MPDQAELTIQGWGPAPDGGQTLSKAARRHLVRELGWTPRETPAVPLDEIRLKPSRLEPEVVTQLTELLGDGEWAGHAAHQDPDADGTTTVTGVPDGALPGQLLLADVVDTEGVDLVATAVVPALTAQR